MMPRQSQSSFCSGLPVTVWRTASHQALYARTHGRSAHLSLRVIRGFGTGRCQTVNDVRMAPIVRIHGRRRKVGRRPRELVMRRKRHLPDEPQGEFVMPPSRGRLLSLRLATDVGRLRIRNGSTHLADQLRAWSLFCCEACPGMRHHPFGHLSGAMLRPCVESGVSRCRRPTRRELSTRWLQR
jgi:hypothetical protein